MPKGSKIALVGFIVLCELAGAVGYALASQSLYSWYSFLNRPWFMPSDVVTGAVWAILYLMMGVSAYLIYRKREGYRAIASGALYMFFLQLIINVILWYASFGLRSTAGGYAVTIILWIALFFTIMEFYRIDDRAAWLLIPYLLWLTFLTLSWYLLLLMNPGV